MSDSSGYIYDEAGIDAEKLAYVMEIKNVNYGRISDYVKKYPSAKFVEGKRPWEVKCDIALPCATQNELNEEEAKTLVANGCFCVAEGANMPSTPEAVTVFQNAKILFAPGKASNAGSHFRFRNVSKFFTFKLVFRRSRRKIKRNYEKHP